MLFNVIECSKIRSSSIVYFDCMVLYYKRLYIPTFGGYLSVISYKKWDISSKIMDIILHITVLSVNFLLF